MRMIRSMRSMFFGLIVVVCPLLARAVTVTFDNQTGLMASRRMLGLMVACALGFAGPARAAPLNWEGELLIQYGELGTATLAGGGVATVNAGSTVPGHLNTLQLRASRARFTGAATLLVTDPDLVGNGIAEVRFEDVQIGSGTFTHFFASAPLGERTMPVHGFLQYCLISTACTSYIEIPLVTSNGVVGVGLGGGVITGGNDKIQITLSPNPWTLLTTTVFTSVTIVTSPTILKEVQPVEFQGAIQGGPQGNTSSTASVNAVGVGGAVQLVTPVQVTTNLPFGSEGKVGMGVTLRVRFIPEPSELLGLFAALGLLAGLYGVRTRAAADESRRHARPPP